MGALRRNPLPQPESFFIIRTNVCHSVIITHTFGCLYGLFNTTANDVDDALIYHPTLTRGSSSQSRWGWVRVEHIGYLMTPCVESTRVSTSWKYIPFQSRWSLGFKCQPAATPATRRSYRTTPTSGSTLDTDVRAQRWRCQLRFSLLAHCFFC